MSDDVGFGFLGAGWIARRALAPGVHAADGARLQEVAARDVDRTARLRPVGRAGSDYRAVLEDPAVDVVYVNLSNDWSRHSGTAGIPVPGGWNSCCAPARSARCTRWRRSSPPPP